MGMLTSRCTIRGETETQDPLNLLRIHDRLVIPHDTHMLIHRRQLTQGQHLCTYDARSRKSNLVSTGEGCVWYRLPCRAVAGYVELSVW